jgi:hypothetical protein
MTRCATNAAPGARFARGRPAALALVLAAAASAASAQLQPGHRVFPAQALRAELVVTAAPEALLDGVPARLAPGARIRGEDNLLVTPAAITGRPLIVHYTREAGSGLLMNVWILRDVERANRPWPTREAEAQRWTFDPAAQTWKKP